MELIIYLLTSFSLGVIHAVEPGHGKMLVMAYLAGSKGNTHDAVFLGIVATIVHTITILLLGAFAGLISTFILSEHLEPAMELLAGVLLVFLGIWIIVQHWIKKDKINTSSHCCFDKHITTFKGTKNTGELLLLGVSGGIVPCSGAIAVLLTSFASGNLVYGVAMITAFSIGLGLSLILLGIFFVKASAHFQERIKFLEHKSTAYIGSSLIVILGIYLISVSLIKIL